MTNTGGKATDQGWDEPWYRVRTDRFEASFLPSADEDLDAVCNVDVEVQLAADGSRWSATVFTLAEVERLMKRANRTRMTAGRAPFVTNRQAAGKNNKYVLHHVTPIQHGGGVCDLDNLTVATPRYRAEVLDPDCHQ